mmetsp:Transcript_38492/g.99480  ORF Transcript_38492/g.99480 Transcript_38492/m.99480 type:complete len:461 (-) Transcript_38492:69-1451(-)
MSSFSPPPGVGLSPVYTPAMLQGELPEWAHPTPSPSIFSVCPSGPMEPNAKAGFAGRAQSAVGDQTPASPVAPQVTMEFLFEVIRPFVLQMCQALQQEFQARVERAIKDGQSKEDGNEGSGKEGSSSTASPLPAGPPSMRLQPGPFHSLLNQTPIMRNSGPMMGRGSPPIAESPGEKGSNDSDKGDLSENASPASSPPLFGRMPAMGEAQAQKVQQRVTFARPAQPPAAGASSNSSPITSDMEPVGRATSSGTGGGGAASGTMGSRTGAAAAASGPLYLAWSEQQPGSGWPDQRRTPTVSPVVPTMEPPGSGAFQSLMLSIDESVGRSASDSIAGQADKDETDEGGEKSIMVCRHWKGKGYCRLEDKCKFLHLEHKKGSGAPPAKPKRSEKDRDKAKASEGEEAAGKEGAPSTSKGRSLRRAGRNRRAGGGSGDGDADHGAAPAAPGLVSPGGGDAGASG